MAGTEEWRRAMAHAAAQKRRKGGRRKKSPDIQLAPRVLPPSRSAENPQVETRQSRTKEDE
jgi:hypothetical protein